jgi:transposase
MRDFLTTSQRASIKQAHKVERDRKIGDRMKAVLWADQGEPSARIAELLLVDEKTVRRHIKDYFDNDRFGGGSGGSQGKLTDEQSLRLQALLASCDVPTALDAAEKARGLFGSKFSISGMTDWLKRMGFSYKKSEPLPSKADPAAQADFVEKYRALKAALPAGEAIIYLDATHPCMASKLAYGWSLKGERKTVLTVSGQTRVNVLGSFDPSTLKMVSTFPAKVDGRAMEIHLNKLRRSYPAEKFAKLHLILDNGSYNRSRATRAHAEKLGIELMFLPPYSPNLNLIERAWRVMNEEVRDNVFFADSKVFESAIKGFWQKTWNKISKGYATRFADNFQTLKPSF